MYFGSNYNMSEIVSQNHNGENQRTEDVKEEITKESPSGNKWIHMGMLFLLQRDLCRQLSSESDYFPVGRR